MELCAPDLLRHDDAAIGRTVIGHGCHPLWLLWLDIIRVREIKIGFGRYIGEDRQSVVQWTNLVPAHMRDLRPLRDTLYRTWKQAQSGDLAFGVVLRQELHAQTDAQEWLAPLGGLANGVIKPTRSHASHCRPT